MKKFLKSVFGSYTARLLYVFITAALLAATIFLGIKLGNINKQQQEEITAIRQSLEQLEGYAEKQEIDENGNPYIYIELEQPKQGYEGADDLADLLTIVQNQNAQTSRDLTGQITIFAIIIAIVALIIPVFNYTFLQKDQIRKINSQHKQLSGEVKTELGRMRNMIVLATNVTEAVANPESEKPEIKAISDSNIDNASAYFLRASLLKRNKEYKKALVFYDKAIELNPQDASYYYQKSVTLCSLKKYEKTISTLDKAIELEPNNEFYIIKIAEPLIKMKKYKEAFNLLYDISESERMDYYYRYLAQAKFGLALLRGEEITDIIWGYFEKAISQDLIDWRNYLAKAEALLNTTELNEAKVLLDKARELNPEDPELYNTYAIYYEKVGETEKAKDYHDLADKHGYIPEPDIEEDDHEKECD